jgi:iron complex transport system ATP-binding protein
MLKILDVSCGYEGFRLTGISLTVKSGELVGIIGPNGSGKTTLLKVIAKTIRPSAGKLLLDGKNLEHLTYRELAKTLAVVSQLTEANLRLTVEELVLLGRTPHRQGLNLLEKKTDLKAAHNAMALTGVLGLRDRQVESLSGGEKQLVFIARALAQEPHLLLLDEPTNHLDITHQVRIMDLISRLNRETGLTVMIVLHDLNLAGQYCDRLVLLKDGAVWKDGSPLKVLTYQTIEEVYDTVVVVLENPVTSKPYVFLVSEAERMKGLIRVVERDYTVAGDIEKEEFDEKHSN